MKDQFMKFKRSSVGRAWFMICETVVIVIPIIGLCSNQRAAFVDPLMPVFKLAWPALLVTSLIFLRFSRGLAWVGFVSCLLSALWFLVPVLAV